MSTKPADNGDADSGVQSSSESNVVEHPIDANALRDASLHQSSSDGKINENGQSDAVSTTANTQSMPQPSTEVSNDAAEHVQPRVDMPLVNQAQDDVVSNAGKEKDLSEDAANEGDVLANKVPAGTQVLENQTARPQPYMPPEPPAPGNTEKSPPPAESKPTTNTVPGVKKSDAAGALADAETSADKKELEKKAKVLLGELNTMSKQQKKDDDSPPPSVKPPRDMDSMALKAIAGALVLVVALGGLVVATGVIQVPGIADLRRAATGEVDCSEPGADCCDGWAQPGSEHCNTSLCQEFKCVEGDWRATGQSCGGGSCEGGTAVCGDGVCNAGETCDSCFTDCNAAGMCDGSVSNFDLYRSGTCILADNTTAEAVVVQTACFVCSGTANDGCNDISGDYLRSCGSRSVTVPAGETQFTVVCSPGDIAACENYQVDAFVDGDSDAIVGEHPTQGDACFEVAPSPTPTTPPGVTPSATPVPSATPTGVPSPTPSPLPSATPTPLPSGAPTPTPSPVPSSTPTPNPSVTPTPVPPTNTPAPNQPTATPTPVALPQSGSMTPTAVMILGGMALLLIGIGGLLAF